MRKIIIFILGILIVIYGVLYLAVRQIPPVEPKIFGVTFSKFFAEKFGLDWKKVYEEILADLGARHLRIPAYWTEVEPENGNWYFDDIDWQLEKAKEYDAKVILAIGRKLPRWPECHEPAWVQSQNLNLKSQNLFEYMRKVVERYDENPAVIAWQVENEPFLPFGDCPLFGKEVLDEEIEIARSLSDKPIIITDSGEFGAWFLAAKRGDVFGSTLYRHVRTKLIGHFTYPLPPSFFRLKQGLLKFFVREKPIIVVELQAEPWLPKMLYETSVGEHFKHFNPERFKKELEYIKGTGFDTFYFWGVEWWYWLKQNGRPEMWDMAKEAIENTR